MIANSRSRKTFYFSLFDSSIFALVLLDLTIWTIYKFFRFNWISSSWASFIHAPTLAYALESQRSLDQHRRLSKIQFFSSLDGSNPDIEKQIFEAKPRRQQNKNLKQLASYGNKIISKKIQTFWKKSVLKDNKLIQVSVLIKAGIYRLWQTQQKSKKEMLEKILWKHNQEELEKFWTKKFLKQNDFSTVFVSFISTNCHSK